MATSPDFPPTIRVGILVYEGFEPIDVWGFTEAFAISRFIGTDYQSPPPYPFEVKLIANEVRPVGQKNPIPTPVKSENGPRVAPDMFRDDALQQPFDLSAEAFPFLYGKLFCRQDDHRNRARIFVRF